MASQQSMRYSAFTWRVRSSAPTSFGAQPNFDIQGDIAVMERLIGLARIRVVTCAPEAGPDGTLARWLSARGRTPGVAGAPHTTKDCVTTTTRRCYVDRGNRSHKRLA